MQARKRVRHLPRSERGFSLLEVSIVATVLVVMSAVIAQSIRSLSRTQSSMRTQTKVTSLVERVVSLIETDVNYSMRVFAEGEYGRAYLTRMALASLLKPGQSVLADAKMSTPTMRGTFERDAPGTEETGNLLLLARKDGCATVDISADSSGVLRRVDLFQFVAWFLHTGSETGVDLARFSSVRVARVADVQAIADVPARARLVKGLWATGVRYAWDPGSAADAAFSALAADGSIVPLSPGQVVPADRSASEAGIFATRHVGIARTGNASIPVPKFANPRGDFPSGLEIKRDGDGSGDLLLIRLVVATRAGREREVACAQATRQVSFRQE